jgi:hypothetical protein
MTGFPFGASPIASPAPSPFLTPAIVSSDIVSVTIKKEGEKEVDAEQKKDKGKERLVEDGAAPAPNEEEGLRTKPADYERLPSQSTAAEGLYVFPNRDNIYSLLHGSTESVPYLAVLSATIIRCR